MAGNQLIIPKSLAMAQSELLTKIKANGKLTNIVVTVKKIFTAACLVFLYLKLKSGTADSRIQKKAMPPTNNNDLWRDGMVLKYSTITSILVLESMCENTIFFLTIVQKVLLIIILKGSSILEINTQVLLQANYLLSDKYICGLQVPFPYVQIFCYLLFFCLYYFFRFFANYQ